MRGKGIAMKINKLLSLEQEMAAAQQAGDQQAIQTIAEQGNALQVELQQLQTKQQE